jgi:6-pyruvoyltetrahydropterin/6-carboxytetrahydropterin synthase
MFELTRRYRFEAAHRLPQVPAEHRCARLHGHTYMVEITIRGPLDAATGWVTDYATIDAAAEPLIDRLDHRYLNELDGLSNPTSECLATWLWDRLVPTLPDLCAITVQENPDARCTYRGASLRPEERP